MKKKALKIQNSKQMETMPCLLSKYMIRIIYLYLKHVEGQII